MNRHLPSLFLAVLLPTVTVAEPLRLLYVGADGDTAWGGVRQGVAEANVLGEFTGRTWTAEARPSPDTTQPNGPQPNTTQAPLAVFTSARGAALARLAEHFQGIPLFNLTDPTDDLRQRCRPNLLHVAPSASMRAAARAQWLKMHPAATSPTLVARAWHADFVKFAARDLNRRYRQARGEPMDDDAWSGWAAVKLVVEAVTRGGSHDPAAMLVTLRDDLEIDGQKGVLLSFRPTGQLRQPLLLVDGENLLGEAPVRGVADLEELDTLGLLTCSTPEDSL